jgi:hypothetical protein
VKKAVKRSVVCVVGCGPHFFRKKESGLFFFFSGYQFQQKILQI